MPVVFLVLALLFAPTLHAQECSHLWVHTLDINPQGPKSMSGDTYAAYGLLGFYRKNNLKLVIKGDFFKGRFMSFESYMSKQKFAVDQLYDHQMVADSGSENPFTEGVSLDTPNRAYTVEVLEKNETSTAANQLRLAPRARISAIFYRAYVPTNGASLTTADLPKVYAVDSRTGAPTACPKGLDTVYDPGIITVILKFVKEKKELTFKEGDYWNGTNHAIPNYVYTLSKVPHGNVSLIKFKAPTHVKVGSTGLYSDAGDVRYWSFCIQNLKESQTLGCLPDFLARTDSHRFVKVAIGGKDIQAFAEANGYNFLEDRRDADTKVLGYFYRNIFPKDYFEAYQGEYLPVGKVCTAQEFTSRQCEY